ncbi:peptide chain release factor N(5)-glutamine methyltransferase [Emticicia agri]|uniref:Release factor glutamine methyltransferase n=1 Tax=Emticicia agri TaxID=2492393 RepID=A0A4Q5LT75_9BACT|nr:peptide chain release factor N(5)-glutamine methyltransferase [Emticicia agri]RYU92629.1 peptide chain release factor N(5)-glutamine methyltransferase [Emticicia agri]
MKDNLTSKQLFDALLHQITVYETQEAKEIVFWLLEHTLGLRKIDILSNRPINDSKNIDWDSVVNRLNSHEPIQYILGEAIFYGRRFLVNDSVLIPRPETEELVAYVCQWEKKTQKTETEKKVLDIGTGSGCIAISLAKELNNAQVLAYDISENALSTAQENADLNAAAHVTFEKVDILQYLSDKVKTELRFDIIVSNPPYVTKKEATQMRNNVLDFEPHLALFVEDNDPLIFYQAIARFASQTLKKDGMVVVEINENLGQETAEVFRMAGFSEAVVIKDIHQKNRFVRASFSKKMKKD